MIDLMAMVEDLQSVPPELQPQQYEGQRDLCHIIPGMLSLSDRNLMPVALSPRPMLAGHGRKGACSHQEHAANFRTICEAQNQALSASASYSYLIHDGGDTMPSHPRRHRLAPRTVFQVAGTVSVPFAKKRESLAEEYGTAECGNSCKY